MLQQMLALVVAYASVAGVSSSLPTFEHTDPVSGQTLQCHRCSAGHYMKAPCTPRQQTLCLPCPQNHFTQFHNYLPKCLYCSTFCGQHQVVVRECSAVHDRLCQCKPGYYMLADFCVKHRDCHPGQGVKRRGDGVQNTECEECPPDMFSAEKSSTAPCVSHTNCTARGLRVALEGSEWHDNICMSCEEQKSKGTLAPLRPILSTLLGYKRLRLGKLRKLARNVLGLRVERGQAGSTRGDDDSHVSHSTERSRLLAVTDQWAQSVSEATLRQLPHRLRRDAFEAALELDIKIAVIEKQMRLCDAEESHAYRHHHHHRHNSIQS